MSASSRMRDAQVVHQIDLIQAANRQSDDLLRVLSRTDRDIEAALRRLDPEAGVTPRQLARTRDRVRRLLDRQSRVLRDSMGVYARELVGVERGFQTETLERIVGPVGLDVRTPGQGASLAHARSAMIRGATLAERLTQFAVGDRQRTIEALNQAVGERVSTAQLVSAVTGTRSRRGRDGARAASRRALEAVVQSATTHVATQTSELLWDANRALFKGILWVAVLDGRTTPICRGLSGRVFPLDRGPRPPAHLSCRSTTSPVFKAARTLGRIRDFEPGDRAEEFDGSVPDEVTYERWLSQRSTAFQRRVLGPRRFRLWRDGGLSLDRFINQRRRVLTLRELAQRTPASFEAAGLTIEDDAA